MMRRQPAVLAALAMLLVVATTPAHPVDLGSPPQGLVVQPPDCLEVPPGAIELLMSGTLNNNRPAPSADPGFPAGICSGLAAEEQPLGPVRSHLTSEVVLEGRPIGTARTHVEACLFAPPPTVVAEMTITVEDGDVLTARINVPATPDSPPPPDSEGSGTGIVTGGTGRFANATGRFNMNAKSHGTVHPGTNVALLRDIAMCGYILLPNADRENSTVEKMGWAGNDNGELPERASQRTSG